MKNTIDSIGKSLRRVLACAALAIGLSSAFCEPAAAQGTITVPTQVSAFFNGTIPIAANLTNNASLSFTNPANQIAIRPKAGLAVQFTFALNNTNASGGWQLLFYPMSDGANFWTTAFATNTLTASGTNAVSGGINWSENTLRGFQKMGVTLTNTVAGVPATNLVSGIVTNSTGIPYYPGLNWSEPNL
ncbi:MAG TPA: hypothetical protein VHY30_01540 [Verrucomicrobiae bacterium]|jgi:hypothetical protein|nr:hypothetical protein [Verrucomicrobiae bacterium]